MTYWTGTWDPAKEAISKEIESLRYGARRRASVVAFSSGNRTRVTPSRSTITLSDRRRLTLRAIAAVIEPTADITHVFGGGSSWDLMRSLGRRPIILTAVVGGPGIADLPLGACSRVVVETDAAAAEWQSAGIPPEMIELIRPGIDLEEFRPAGAAPERFSLLFASTPAELTEFEGRGIPFLVDLARERPDIDIVVPWRQWGDIAAARRRLEDLRPPSNFKVRHEKVDMPTLLQSVHATVVAFDTGVGKSCPNFVIEGLAAGRPAIIARGVEIAGLVGAHRAGISTDRTVADFAAAIDVLKEDWSGWSARARLLAEREFSLSAFRARYEAIYRALVPSAS